MYVFRGHKSGTPVTYATRPDLAAAVLAPAMGIPSNPCIPVPEPLRQALFKCQYLGSTWTLLEKLLSSVHVPEDAVQGKALRRIEELPPRICAVPGLLAESTTQIATLRFPENDTCNGVSG